MLCAIKEQLKNYFCFSNSWFRPSENNKYDWEDIKIIIEADPLKHEPTRLKSKIIKKISIWCKDYLIYLILFVLLSISLSIKTASAGIMAVIAGLITIHNATNQLVAKVRSENRQKWIDDVRNSLAEAITYMYIFDPNAHTEDLSTVTEEEKNKKAKLASEEKDKAERVRFRLELLMNPSEKDHRTIGYLLRKAYRVKKMERIDKSIEENLGSLLDQIVDINALENSICQIKDYDKLISWLIRLSNATLKREWELVKIAKLPARWVNS
jgi:hypothetical protein